MAILKLPIDLQYEDANGLPRSGAQLFVYLANSSTKATLYQDAAGGSNHSNPIVLNTLGQTANSSAVAKPVFTVSGQSYDVVLAPSNDTDPPVSPYFTLEDIPLLNDTTVSVGQWVSGPTPTYVSATSFTLVGDQTSEFHVGRRIKTTNSGGTIYSTIITSAYTTLTTITVVNDSGSLDSGISAVSYGILSATNDSTPAKINHALRVTGNLTFDKGIGPNYVNNLGLAASVSANALTVALKGQDGSDPAAITNVVEVAFRSTTLTTGTPVIRQITSATSVVAPATATLGFVANETAYIHIFIADDGSTRELGLCGKHWLFDEGLRYSTTAIGTGSDSSATLYTTSALTNAAIRYLGRITIQTDATTAGNWSNEDTVIHLAPVPPTTPKMGASEEQLDKKTASASTRLTFQNLGSLDELEFTLVGLRPTTDNTVFKMEWSTDNGATWIAANYEDGGTNSSAGANAPFGASRAYASLSGEVGVGNAATRSINGKLQMFAPSNAALHKQVTWHCGFITNGGVMTNVVGTARYTGATTAINAVSFYYGTRDVNTIAEGYIVLRGKRYVA